MLFLFMVLLLKCLLLEMYTICGSVFSCCIRVTRCISSCSYTCIYVHTYVYFNMKGSWRIGQTFFLTFSQNYKVILINMNNNNSSSSNNNLLTCVKIFYSNTKLKVFNSSVWKFVFVLIKKNQLTMKTSWSRFFLFGDEQIGPLLPVPPPQKWN